MAQIANELLKACGAFFYDCETYNLIPSEDVARDPEFTYCAGWSDFKGMGISVISGYDFMTGDYKIFLVDNMTEFRQIVESRDVVISFNGHHFDDQLILAHGIDLPRRKSYDLWKEITTTQPPGLRSGFSLNDMLKANNLPSKSGHGGDAPKLAQRGRWGQLISYCLGDTMRGVNLLRLACNGLLLNPKTQSYLAIKKPWEIVEVEPGVPLF